MLVHPGSITPNQVTAKYITAACWHYSGRSISTPVASCTVSRPYILGKVAFNKIQIALAYVGRLVILNTYVKEVTMLRVCLLYTSPSPRDGLLSRMPSSA